MASRASWAAFRLGIRLLAAPELHERRSARGAQRGELLHARLDEQRISLGHECDGEQEGPAELRLVEVAGGSQLIFGVRVLTPDESVMTAKPLRRGSTQQKLYDHQDK